MDEDIQQLRREIRQCPDCSTTGIDDLSTEEFSTATWLDACEIHRGQLVELAESSFSDSHSDN